MINAPIHFQGLNGLRAIAAIAVVLYHITIALGEFGLDPYLFGAYDDGHPMGLSLAGYGVTIFFVLSGFLITYLLQVERERRLIDIRKFYVRRVLRIWPLYYVYFALCLLTMLVAGETMGMREFLLYTFYAANVPLILGVTTPLLAHYWSLGVEEQFYMFWPWVNKYVVALPRLCLFGIAIIVGTKIALHIFDPGSLLERIIHITRFHCMLIGAYGAVMYKSGNALFMRLIDNKLVQVISWLVILLILVNRYHVASVVDMEIISCVALFLIIGQIRVTNRIINLEVPFMNLLGKISYGIYVVHPLVIYFVAKGFGDMTVNVTLKYLLVFGIVLVSTFLVAYVSYLYMERYFLTFKKKYEVVRSSP